MPEQSKASKSEEAIQRPVGRDEVIAAALQAAADLFAENNPSQVSVREIARRSGVSHALIHRYLGTKDDIFKAAVEAERDKAIATWKNADSVNEAQVLLGGNGQPTRYMAILFRAHLEGIDVDEYTTPAMTHLSELLRAHPLPNECPELGGFDMRVVLLTAMAATSSMSIAHEFFSHAVGLAGMETPDFHDQYQRLILHLLSLGQA